MLTSYVGVIPGFVIWSYIYIFKMNIFVSEFIGFVGGGKLKRKCVYIIEVRDESGHSKGVIRMFNLGKPRYISIYAFRMIHDVHNLTSFKIT